jgi:hypothetical protein
MAATIAPGGVMSLDLSLYSQYMIRKQMLKLFGGSFRVYNPQGQLVLFASMKAFKLKEDIRVYTGEDKQTEVLIIKARSIIDFSAAYDVIDAARGNKIGVLKRKGWKSALKDEWIIMDERDQEIGLIQEDSWALALLRRFLTNLIPQHYEASIGALPAATYRQNFNPFTFKLAVDFSPDAGNRFDRRLGLAAGILLCAIEGRQS